jgi:hypothetical protein
VRASAERHTRSVRRGLLRCIATGLRRYSYRFAMDHLEPEALVRVRDRMCDLTSEEARRDADAVKAVCQRLSQDY